MISFYSDLLINQGRRRDFATRMGSSVSYKCTRFSFVALTSGVSGVQLLSPSESLDSIWFVRVSAVTIRGGHGHGSPFSIRKTKCREHFE